MDIQEQIQQKFAVLSRVLNERQLRLFVAAEARALGYGGIAVVAQATGMARSTIGIGLSELDALEQQTQLPPPTKQRVRRPGGGRKNLEDQDKTLLFDLEALIEPSTRGDPQSPLRWTCKSTAQLAKQLTQQGHTLSARSVGTLLHWLGYSLQSNRKTQEGKAHPDRNAQFAYLNAQAQAFLEQAQPVVSVDTKKKELVGNFKNGGQEWQAHHEPVQVYMHDFPDPNVGKAIPYGVYDLCANQGFVSVGIDHDTAEFAVQALRYWWYAMGQPLYPEAKRLLITCDCGGSNGARSRLWKVQLQDFADESGLEVHLCHYPPGTSKWNKIEHRLFCHITQNWRGRPLTDYATIVSLIGHTTTTAGLKVQAALDTNAYPRGIKVSEQELSNVRLIRDAFHGEWNYTILPRDNKR